MGEMIRDRIPLALERVGRLLGGDRANQLSRPLREDLLALHAAATEYATAQAEVERLRAELIGELQSELALASALGGRARSLIAKNDWSNYKPRPMRPERTVASERTSRQASSMGPNPRH